ncbi:hypothetical protein RUM44_009530 [Polyplax serrata]|uniref:BED-type domain-containing protein n=1 Tax=Polyplax serrata TaxID=468196 RepID=A0ABR1AUD8_POLSC
MRRTSKDSVSDFVFAANVRRELRKPRGQKKRPKDDGSSVRVSKRTAVLVAVAAVGSASAGPRHRLAGSSLSVWDFFTGNSIEKTAMCILCNMVLKVQPNSGVWNLKRHVSRLHPREFERYSKKMNPAGSQQSVIWNCFTKSWEERTAVCKMCGLMFDCNVKPTMKMKQHLLQSHRDCVIDTVVKKEQ